MGRLLILLAMTAGCADGDPHELGACGATWSGSLGCEAACQQRPNMTGPSCRATCTPNDDGPCSGSNAGDLLTCDSTFAVDGQAGCCLEAGGPDRRYVLLLECID